MTREIEKGGAAAAAEASNCLPAGGEEVFLETVQRTALAVSRVARKRGERERERPPPTATTNKSEKEGENVQKSPGDELQRRRGGLPFRAPPSPSPLRRPFSFGGNKPSSSFFRPSIVPPHPPTLPRSTGGRGKIEGISGLRENIRPSGFLFIRKEANFA